MKYSRQLEKKLPGEPTSLSRIWQTVRFDKIEPLCFFRRLPLVDK
jgi:hypothetical protein